MERLDRQGRLIDSERGVSAWLHMDLTGKAWGVMDMGPGQSIFQAFIKGLNTVKRVRSGEIALLAALFNPS